MIMCLYTSVISVCTIAFWTVLDYFRSLCIWHDSSIDSRSERTDHSNSPSNHHDINDSATTSLVDFTIL